MAELEAKLTALRLERERNKQRLAALSEQVASKVPQRPPAPAPKAETASFSNADLMLPRQPPAQVSVHEYAAAASSVSPAEATWPWCAGTGLTGSLWSWTRHAHAPLDDHTQLHAACNLRNQSKSRIHQSVCPAGSYRQQSRKLLATQGTTQLSEAGAAAIAALLAMLRGPDDPAAQPSACGIVAVASLCDLYMVRKLAAENVTALPFSQKGSASVCKLFSHKFRSSYE